MPAELESFDPDVLRDKYRAERDKRLRPDGNEQYVEMTGRFAAYLDDPYTPVVERGPLTDTVEVLVIGAGFGGLLVGARLREAGVTSLRLVEKGGDVGGTWYWNRYPGAACDVESYIYLPLIEEVGTVPSQKYAAAAEILDHSRAIARHYDLYRDLVLSTVVTELRWDDRDGLWTVSTDRGDAMRARFVVMANGPLHRPKLPGIPGIEDFAGHSFHTSRWDYDYTGGGPDGGLDRLADKVVGIIGTGATAVQCVPHLGASAKHLYVFQRTPSSIDVRSNRPTDPEWFASLAPGWQQRRMDNFNNLVSGIPEPEDLVDDGWTDIIGNLLLRMRRGDAAGDLADAVELADFEKMNQIRSRVDELVDDPATAEALKPWYRQFCKRPCFHDEYLQTFNRPNVTLVDTVGKGVEQITASGVVAAGVEYPVDCLIYATGFEVGTEYTRRSGYEVVGRDGLTMTEKWADGAITLHGFHMHDFPNCFVVSLVQSGFSVNFPHMLDVQARHLGHLLGHAQRNGITRIEATAEAEQAWAETIVSLAQMNLGFLEQCTPGYYNNEGRPAARSLRNSSYGAGSGAFAKLLEEWRDAGEFEGLELTTSSDRFDRSEKSVEEAGPRRPV
jgi:cyclohexanone monooxygenase